MPRTRAAGKNQKLDSFIKSTPKQKEVKKVLYNKLNGKVLQFQREMLRYRESMLNQLDYKDVEQQVYGIVHKKHNEIKRMQFNKQLRSIIFLILSRVANDWGSIFYPLTINDFIEAKNVSNLQTWLKQAYKTLKSNYEDDDSELEQQKTGLKESQDYQYRLLNLYGDKGKLATIQALARDHQIEIIFTNQRTEQKDFEELFRCQKLTLNKCQLFKSEHRDSKETSIFEAKESQNKKKLIVHKGQLPKYFTTIIKDQKIPLILLSDECELNQVEFDKMHFIQYTHKAMKKYLYLITIIQENYGQILNNYRHKIKNHLTYELIEKMKDQFDFESFDIIQPFIPLKQIRTSLTLEQLDQLVKSMNGNMKKIIDWIQINHISPNLEKLLQQEIINKPKFSYKLQNEIPLNVNRQQLELTQRLEDECDDIMKERNQLLKQSLKSDGIFVKYDTHQLYQVFKNYAFGTQQFKYTRLKRSEEIDPYKPIERIFPGKQLEKFRYLDTLDMLC
ncbi:hypothetical protein pb186bvf_003219 [Paramecium bursaria]